ncbi:glycosyltransferase family 4 protein [Longibacter salinarum]|uniref:glycosyltransferase family 4 protein n=1 Tax=Longibacter salinarum TaxID=1850348 RepID=UPI0015CF0B20|nr:glycosyltransferase family 4 protein [Longibacter salinarum]
MSDSTMRVLLLSQYFPPETGGTSNRMLSVAQGFQRNGHEVVVVAEKPNHPEGIIRPEYRGGLFEEREYEGIPVIYTWVRARPEKTFISRILFYVSFMITSVLGALKARGSFDVVIASSPPLFVGLSGWAAARLKGARFVFDVRDIWPEVAVAMGELTNPVMIRVAEEIEAFIYSQADGITAVTDSFCEHISRVVGSGTPTQRVMNGTVPDVFDRPEARKPMREALGVEDDTFVVAYAGNVGLAQGLPHIINAADHLADRDDIEIHIVGSGPVKEELVTLAREKERGNVRFFDRVPLEEAAAHMAASDALLVPLGDNPIYRQFIPSKLFDSMAAGRPVLLSVDGEARDLLDEANAGLSYPAENAHALADAICELADDRERAKDMGQAGRQFSRSECTRREQADRLVNFVEQIVAG